MEVWVKKIHSLVIKILHDLTFLQLNLFFLFQTEPVVKFYIWKWKYRYKNTTRRSKICCPVFLDVFDRGSGPFRKYQNIWGCHRVCRILILNLFGGLTELSKSDNNTISFLIYHECMPKLLAIKKYLMSNINQSGALGLTSSQIFCTNLFRFESTVPVVFFSD